nr:MAG TPA: hypothetical protein [Caudoviricetes sp.]
MLPFSTPIKTLFYRFDGSLFCMYYRFYVILF